MSAALDQVFRNRSVLITGHTGFKGAWLALWLHCLGARVSGYALAPPTTPSLFEAIDGPSLLGADHRADIRDPARLAAALNEINPDVVLHLAARAIVRESYAEPRDTFDVNVMGTCNVLDGLRRRGKPCAVVVVSSDKCYDNREQLWGYRECDPLGGTDPYSASKGACELVVASYRQSFFPHARLAVHGVKLASARAGNVIGGGDWARDRIVPDVVRSLVAGRPVPVRSPSAVRPWQHVLEPLSGYLLLAARLLTSDDPRWCGAWNFGPVPGSERCVAELVEQLCQAWGGGTWQDISTPETLPEAHTLRLAIDKAQVELGWRPRWGLRQTAQRTAQWYRRFHEQSVSAVRALCLEDIAAYEHSPAGE